MTSVERPRPGWGATRRQRHVSAQNIQYFVFGVVEQVKDTLTRCFSDPAPRRVLNGSAAKAFASAHVKVRVRCQLPFLTRSTRPVTAPLVAAAREGRLLPLAGTVCHAVGLLECGSESARRASVSGSVVERVSTRVFSCTLM
jgi:hypothetical protein